MVNIDKAINEVKEAKRLEKETKEKNYRYLLSHAESPCESDLYAYEGYIDSVIMEESKKGNNFAYFRTFSSNNIESLLEEYNLHSTTYIDFSVFCNMLNTSFYEKVVKKYEKEGYIVKKHSAVDYRIDWFKN